MRKKILLALATVLIVAGGVAALSAYEAHVINVTARIENALAVNPKEIAFGTVFPQEYLEEELIIRLSDSFLLEDRVDDVEYVIKQKPKPYDPGDHEYCLESWEIALDGFMDCFMFCLLEYGGTEEYCWHQCKDILFDYDEVGKCYPPLCWWLSKTPDGTPDNDHGVGPFEGIFDVASGRLAKSDDDIEDTWIIDLIVSCFQGMCAQDYNWEEFGPPLPPELEGETFGCDLWIEVTGISRYSDYVCGNGILEPGEECETNAGCTELPNGSCNPPGGVLPCKCKYSVLMEP